MVVLPQDSAWIVINKNGIYSNTTTKSFSSDRIFSRLFSLGLFSDNRADGSLKADYVGNKRNESLHAPLTTKLGSSSQNRTAQKKIYNRHNFDIGENSLNLTHPSSSLPHKNNIRHLSKQFSYYEAIKDGAFTTNLRSKVAVYKTNRYMLTKVWKPFARWSSVIQSVDVTYTPLPDNHLGIIFTTGDIVVSNKLRFTFRVLCLYKKQFNVRPVLFTKSNFIGRIAKQYDIDVLPEGKTNEYGMPFINSMLAIARDTFHFKQIIYINADIVINPGIFSLAAYFDEYFKSKKYVLVGTVMNVRDPSYNMNTEDYEVFKRQFSDIQGRYRGAAAIDVFVFPSTFPFEKMWKVVVGRWYVDSAILVYAHGHSFDVVDITSLASIHLSLDESVHVRSRVEYHDFFWNKGHVPFKADSVDGYLQGNYFVMCLLCSRNNRTKQTTHGFVIHIATHLLGVDQSL